MHHSSAIIRGGRKGSLLLGGLLGDLLGGLLGGGLLGDLLHGLLGGSLLDDLLDGLLGGGLLGDDFLGSNSSGSGHCDLFFLFNNLAKSVLYICLEFENYNNLA